MAITTLLAMGIIDSRVPSATTPELICTIPDSRVYTGIVISASNQSADTSSKVSAYLVPPGQSVSVAYRVYPPTLIPALVTVEFALPHALSAGFSIYTQVDVGDITSIMTSANVLV